MQKVKPMRLGVNIDHVATLRNARGENYPDPLRAAKWIEARGIAEGITVHLREDRRHIRDEDVRKIAAEIGLPLNLEIASEDAMVAIAKEVKPHAVCIVPEKREEITTEGGLDVVTHQGQLRQHITQLKEAGIRVSLFIDPDKAQVEMSKEVGAEVVELHTGKYANTKGETQNNELIKLQDAAAYTDAVSLECHAGHGLNYENVMPIAAIPQVVELNIGHFLMAESMFVGLELSIVQMRELIDQARP